jgi:hypothetical protein
MVIAGEEVELKLFIKFFPLCSALFVGVIDSDDVDIVADAAAVATDRAVDRNADDGVVAPIEE